jgi:hypothetical protein
MDWWTREEQLIDELQEGADRGIDEATAAALTAAARTEVAESFSGRPITIEGVEGGLRVRKGNLEFFERFPTPRELETFAARENWPGNIVVGVRVKFDLRGSSGSGRRRGR